ncbi:hypothetical protein GCM10025787_16730 [Saccharopolyspora rosea]|uniref:Zinc finger protein n=1 Tax=Saccharopolyspora rosea TaxID=524884 RepID=A0ABW3FVL3_9PSEU
MHPFHWVPGDGARHASLDARPEGVFLHPTGAEVRTLCGLDVLADNSQLAWLWETCPECNAEAHRISARSTTSGRTR